MRNRSSLFMFSLTRQISLLLFLGALCFCVSCSQKSAAPIAKATKKAAAATENMKDKSDSKSPETKKDESNSTDEIEGEENKKADSPDELSEKATAEAGKDKREAYTTGPSEDKKEDGETSDTEDVSSATERKEEKNYESELMVLFAPGGPILIEWMLSIDERPYRQALEQLVDEVLEMADVDEDGRSTWEELTTDRRVIYGQFGNLAIENERSRRQVMKLYDIDRDKLVDRDELPRFLTRNAGGSKSFSLRNARDYLDRNRAESNLRKLLDVDANGVISAEEILQAKVRLQSRDADDNDIIVAADFTPFTVSPQQMNRRRRSSGPDSASMLDSRTDWSMFVYSLEERYSSGGLFDEKSFPLFPSLLKRLDTDEDDGLDDKEAMGLEKLKPHIQLSVNFGLREEGAGPVIQLVSLCVELKDQVRVISEQEARVVLELPAVEIEFFINDSAGAGQFKNQVDQQFPLIDTDKNGYLEKEEYEGAGRQFFGRFEAADGDGDGKIFPEEAVAYFSRQQAVVRSQIRARAGDQSDALFTAIDSNNDGRLTSREIETVTERLLQFDADGDGEISIDEIPAAISVGLARGNPQLREQLFVVPAQQPRAADKDVPRWFVLMDSNGDGDISSREFLGDLDQFRKLDTNGDSFLDAGEIAPKSTPSSGSVEDAPVDAEEPQAAEAESP